MKDTRFPVFSKSTSKLSTAPAAMPLNELLAARYQREVRIIDFALLDCELLSPGTQACERPACDNDKEEVLRKRHINAT